MINLPQDSTEVEDPASVGRPVIGRWALVLLMLLGAAGIGGIAGLLSGAAGNNVPTAILTAGGAFAGAAGLMLAIAHYANPRP